MISRMTTMVVGVICLTTMVQASQEETGLTATAEQLVDTALEADGGAGMQVAVIKNGELIFSYAVGHADLENDVALSTATRMRIGSVSKIFTTTLIARLAQTGSIGIDADIRKYVDEFPDKDDVITVRQLASHLSGIRHYDFTNMAEANNMQYYESLVDAIRVFAADPLLSTPGSEHHYSGFGINLLGIAAEKVSGIHYAQALQKYVADPLELNNTLVDHPLAITPRRTRFYTVLGGQLVNTFWRDSSDYYPSGGLLSSAEDIARLTSAVFEGEFLDKERQALVRTEATLSNGEGVGYTFGWQIEALQSGETLYSHGGETNGAYANVLYAPARNLIVTGIANYNVFPDQSEVAFFTLVREQLSELF